MKRQEILDKLEEISQKVNLNENGRYTENLREEIADWIIQQFCQEPKACPPEVIQLTEEEHKRLCGSGYGKIPSEGESDQVICDVLGCDHTVCDNYWRSNLGTFYFCNKHSVDMDKNSWCTWALKDESLKRESKRQNS